MRCDLKFTSVHKDPRSETIEIAVSKMSSISIATLPRMSRDVLSSLLLSTSTPSKLAIIDVRDSGKDYCERQINIMK